MRCTCKLKEKLKEAQVKKHKYSKKCDRISKMIANREGKKLRLVTWEYEGKTTMYVVYQASPDVQHSDTHNICFFTKESFIIIPCSSGGKDVKKLWIKEGSKISHDAVTYYGKEYRLNKKAQVCEVVYSGIFKKRTTEIVVCDLMKELK